MSKNIYKIPIYIAHDHMNRYEDFIQDIGGGVKGKILHLTLDGWIDAPNKSSYVNTYDNYEGFYERYISALNDLDEILKKNLDKFKLVRTYSDLSNALVQGKFSIILGNEGGKIVGVNAENLEELFSRGIRHMQLNWSMKNRLSASQGEENTLSDSGLSHIGEELVEKMNNLGIIVDVSHSSPKTITRVLDISSKPILNSHSGSRFIANKQQNLWDHQIKNLSDNDGILAVHFCSRLVLGENDKQSKIEDVITQIKYVKNIGGIDMIALGPDWILGNEERDSKYTYNTDQKNITWTKNLENSSCIKNIIDPLLKSGFKEREIESILYLNLDRFFKVVLPSE